LCAVRNKDNVLAFYEEVINQKKAEEAVHKYMSPAYIQHNPLIGDGPDALGQFFGKITKERARARVVVHRIVAIGDYVWAHVNFLNLFNDDAGDTGIAGTDNKMGADGDRMAVTDNGGKVRGVDGLFIGDASLRPTIPCANTNLPTIMMAEKIADGLKARR